MERLYPLALVILLLATRAVAVEPLPTTGVALLEACHQAQRLVNGEQGSVNAGIAGGYCLGYTAALMALSVQVAPENALAQPLYCLAGALTVGDGVSVIVRYLESHPDQLQRDQGVLAIEALAEAYPCTRAQ